jgi:pimeloyl-ACP methyl ester carboxylesterase
MPTLPVNGYEMAFVECGTGIPLILVHGSLTDYRWWAQQMQPFGAHALPDVDGCLNPRESGARHLTA